MNKDLGAKAEHFERESRKVIEQLESLTKKHDRLMNILMMLHPEVAEMMQDPPEQSANTQEQQGAQASNAQFSQQQKPNTHASGTGFDQQQSRAANDSNMSSSRSSNLSSSSNSNTSGQLSGPNSELIDVQPMYRSQSLSSLRSDDSAEQKNLSNRKETPIFYFFEYNVIEKCYCSYSRRFQWCFKCPYGSVVLGGTVKSLVESNYYYLV